MRGRTERRDNRGTFYRNKLIATMIIVMGVAISINSADNKTEFGVMDDFTVWGVEGTLDDPDLEIKGFSVFGATQTAYTANIANGPGNVMINGVLGVSSGAYIAGISTISYINSINTSSLTITGNGITGSSAIFKVAGSTMVILNNGNVGIGTSAPNLKLTILSETPASNDGVNIYQYADTAAPIVQFYRARGTLSLPTAIDTARTLGNLYFYGYNGTEFVRTARIEAISENAYTSTSTPSMLKFYTTMSGSVSDAERMRITGSGNVGIGTMDPKGKLHAVETNLNNSYIFVASTATDSGSYKVVVSTTGNVGIGTTAPNAKLDVSGSLRATSLTNNITSSAFVMNVGSANGSTGSPAVALWGVSDTYYPGAVHLITQNGNIQFYNYNGSSWSELMRITSGGNVGIGTTSPEEKLEVNGDIKANNFKGKLNRLKIYAGVRTFSSGSCGDSVNSPCQVDISGGGFSGTPVCTITMQNIDSTGYTENMVIKSVSSTALYLWKGQYQNEGTTMIVNWICVGG